MKVLAINSSPRHEGNTSRLLGHVLAGLEKEGIETELVQIGGSVIRGCTVCNLCTSRKDGRCSIDNDPVNSIIGKMRESDGIIFGSPVYFSDITPELKALIDRSGRVSRAAGFLLRRKVGAGVLAVRRGGEIHALDTIHHFMHISQMIVPGATYWNFGVGRDAGDVENDEEGIVNMASIAENMAWLIKKINA